MRTLKESVMVLGLASILFVAPEFISKDFGLVDLAYAVFSNQVAFAPIILLAIFSKPGATQKSISILWKTVILSLLCCLVTVIIGVSMHDDVLVSAAPIVGVIVTLLGLTVFWGHRAFSREET